MTLLNAADAVYLGTAKADRVYLGATQIWPAPAVQPAVYVTWDAARKSASCTLTNNQASFNTQGSVAATLSVDAATANRYAEFTVNAITGNVIGMGIMRSDYTALDKVLGAEAVGSASRWSDGSCDFWVGAATDETTGGATFAVGDVIAVLLKRGALYYGKCAAGVTTWLDGCDPVAETGGAVTGIAGRYALALGAYASGNPRTATLNTGASAWVGQPPAGAVGWALAPTLGAHTMFKGEDQHTATPVVADAINTFNPTSIFISRAGFASLVVAPTDNKGNAYGDLGSPGVYAGYSGEFDARNYWTGDAVGGANHVVMLDNSSNPTREVTMEVLEVVRAAGYGVPITAVAYTYDSGKPTLQGPTIHVGGPSLLVAVWSGDSGQLNHTAVPDAAWSVVDSFLTLPPNSAVQYCVACRDVIDAGDYTVEWAQTPTQGSPLWIFAFENQPPAPRVTIDLSALPSILTVGTSVSFVVSAANEDGATGAITISAASLPLGLSIGATTGSGPYTATVSGTPTTEAAAADFTISASNGAQSVSGTWSVTVNPEGVADLALTGHSGLNTAARVSSLAFPIPTTAAAGDYALVCINRDGTTTPALPAGWALLNTGTASADGQRASIYGKQLVAGDLGSSVTFSLNGTNWATGTISTWSGVDAANVKSTVLTNSTGNPKPVTMTATGVTAVTAGSVLVGMFCRDATDPHNQWPAAPTGWTFLDGTDDSLGWSNMSSSYTTQAAAGNAANVTALDTSSGGGWITFMVALPPA